MLTFAAQVTDSNGSLIQIGDNDSGKIVAGLYVKPRLHDTLSSYKDFGLTIIRNNGIHLTFRHATFAPYQPSGHFHYDQLSITLSINGIPILVDPGSYCYTSQPIWRNTFRDFSYHNSMHLESPTLEQRIDKELDLFQLKRIQESSQVVILDQEKTIELVDRYQVVQEPDIAAHRSLDLDKNTRIITLYDWWTAEHNPKHAVTWWSFVFAPSIQLELDEQANSWIIRHNNNPLGCIRSTLPLESTQGWFSPAYGVKQACIRLVAQLPLNQIKQKTTVQLF